MTDLSVILPTLNAQLADAAIANLHEACEGLDYEIIVIGPKDAQVYSARTVHIVQEPTGTCAANNAGYAAAEGKLVVLWSDDKKTSPGALTKAVKYYLEHCQDKPTILGINVKWGAYPNGTFGTVFGEYYAYHPMVAKSVVETHLGGKFLDPVYVSHYADCDLALRFNSVGGVSKCFTDVALVGVDRGEVPESPLKQSSYAGDLKTFMERWYEGVNRWWGPDTWQFNIDRDVKLLQDGQFSLQHGTAGLTPGFFVMPSSGRPGRAEAALRYMKAQGMKAPGYIVVDKLDTANGSYKDIELPDGWSLVHIPESTSADCYRWAYDVNPRAEWYGIVTDDLVAESPEWDRLLVERAGETGIASANDCWQAPKRMHGAIVIGGELVRRVGNLCPAPIEHCFFDDMWERIGTTLRCWFVEMDVITRHDHPMAPNSTVEVDETYAKANDQDRFMRDRAVFQQWSNKQFVQFMQAWGPLWGAFMRPMNFDGIRVCFLIPCLGGELVQEFMTSMSYTSAAFAAQRIPYSIITLPDDSLIHRARNHLLLRGYEDTEATHFVFIDADMGWSPDDLLRMLTHRKGIVAAAGPRKRDEPSFCFVPLDGPATVDLETNTFPVKAAGTGMMVIAREVVTEMIEKYNNLWYIHADGKKYYNLFDCILDEERHELWSEDYVFCNRYRAIGGTVWVDPEVGMSHVGRKVFYGKLSEDPHLVSTTEKTPSPDEQKDV